MLNEFFTNGMFQIILAAFLGMAVGFEREKRGKPAGLRTHALVSMGSALFTILSVTGFASFVGNTSYDPSRIASQVVVGIGFLGAGIIFFAQNKVQGLTTAAGVWVSATIGMAVGLKFYALSVLTSILTILILWWVRSLERKMRTREESDESS